MEKKEERKKGIGLSLLFDTFSGHRNKDDRKDILRFELAMVFGNLF